MKKNEILLVVLAIAVLLVGIGCSDNLNEEVTQTERTLHSINISTRTAEEGVAINWPLTLFAFNTTTGSLVTKTIVEDVDASAELKLNKGNYTLVALAGTDGLSNIEEPELTEDIGIPEENFLVTAPQIATQTIQVVSDDINADMNLAYAVAQVRIILTDMPSIVTSAMVTLSSLYTSIAFNGTASGNGTATLILTKQDDGSWASNNIYVMPSVENLELAIATNDESYTITTNSKLEAGKTYTLNGTYKGEVIVTVTFDIKDWVSEGEIDFDIIGKEDSKE